MKKDPNKAIRNFVVLALCSIAAGYLVFLIAIFSTYSMVQGGTLSDVSYGARLNILKDLSLVGRGLIIAGFVMILIAGAMWLKWRSRRG